jgi:hypothetical protein
LLFLQDIPVATVDDGGLHEFVNGNPTPAEHPAAA